MSIKLTATQLRWLSDLNILDSYKEGEFKETTLLEKLDLFLESKGEEFANIYEEFEVLKQNGYIDYKNAFSDTAPTISELTITKSGEDYLEKLNEELQKEIQINEKLEEILETIKQLKSTQQSNKQSMEEIKSYLQDFEKTNVDELNGLHRDFLVSPETIKYDVVNPDLLSSLKKKVSILITTVTNIETYMLHKKLLPLQGSGKITKLFKNDNTYYIGRIGNYNIVNVMSGMGSYTVGGSADVLKKAIVYWEPKIIISLGIAFGISVKKQKLGDVLISSTIVPYDKNSKIENGVLLLRDPWFPQTSTLLRDRINNVANLRNEKFRTHLGCILTGENLIDDPSFKQMILKATQAYNIIGGEMEAYGVFKTASENQIHHCLTIKGVCDWAEGKNALSDDPEENTNLKEKLQLFAARNAVLVCEKLFSEDYTFTDIGIKSENEKKK